MNELKIILKSEPYRHKGECHQKCNCTCNWFEDRECYVNHLLHRQAQLTREETIKEVIEFIANKEGWEESRDYYLSQLLNKNNNE